MSKEYQDTWTGDDSTINESYLSADASPSNNSTQYFSMLEDSAVHDDTTVQLGTSLDETTTTEAVNDADALLQEPDRVVLYRIEGSDDMYAVQVAEDENGKLQKYQFKVRPTLDGQYEAVQETITVIPFDASDPIIPNVLDEPAIVPTMISDETAEEQQVHVKCEQVVSGEQHQLTVVDNDDGDGGEFVDHDNDDGSGTVLGAVGGLEMEDYQYDEEEGHIPDTKEGILHLQSMHLSNDAEPSSHDLKLEYYHEHNSAGNTADESQNHLHTIDHTHQQEQEQQQSEPITNITAMEQDISQKQQEQVDDEDIVTPVDESSLYSQLNDEDVDEEDTAELLTDGIEYVGVEEPDYDGSIVDESTQLEHGEEDEQQQVFEDDGGDLAVADIDTDEDDAETEYIIATGMDDGDMTDDNGGIGYQQIFVTNDEQLKAATLNNSPSAIKTYLNASQLQQLTLAAATSNNNQLPPNAAYIVTKIINENQSITTTATSIDQGVKLVRSLKIKRITNPPINNVNNSAPSVPHLVHTIPNSFLNNSSASRIVEKENVSNVNTNVISNMLKPNPRSILKASHIILRKSDRQPPAEENIDKRFARSKELQRKRMFRDFIAQTTILQAPIRQERLPRKQLIKPVHRTDEEIIVREMVITSNGNGFIEAMEDKAKEHNVTSANKNYEQLSDSDSDFKPYSTGKRKRKYKKRKQQNSDMPNPEDVESDDSVMSSSLQEAIDLSADSEGEEIIETIIINSPGKRRGRPPKPKFDPNSPRRRGRPPKNRQSNHSSTLPEETIRIVPSTENKCSLCSKVFPSVGSLRSHMNFHKYMEEKPESKPEQIKAPNDETSFIPANKYSCSKCNSSFKNAILLTKHIALHDKKDKFECRVCRKVFSDNGQLITHKKSHIKDHMFQSTEISPQKRTKASASSFNCFVCNKSFSSKVLLEAHMKSHKNVFSCRNCGRNFMSKVLLDKHVRLECVKRRSIETDMKISFVAKSTVNNSTESSVFAKPSAKLIHPRRTTLRSMSTTSQEDENSHADNSIASQDPVSSSTESISSVTSSLNNPATLRTPANRKSTAGRITSSNIKSSGLQLNLKCDDCGDVFSTFKLRYKHQVIKHGMPTADTTINAVSEEKEKRRLYKPVPGHSGVPANPNLAKVFAALQEKIKHI